MIRINIYFDLSQARAFYGFQIAMENIHSGTPFFASRQVCQSLHHTFVYYLLSYSLMFSVLIQTLTCP